MASGCAVVATAVGGVPEIVRDQIDGLLVPPGDPSSLASALESLSNDPEMLMRYASAARQRVSSYSVAEMTGSVVASYLKACG
jgi:glycosyltransferase involved in cell wall biosynthesis